MVEKAPYNPASKQSIYHYAVGLRGSTLREESHADEIADIRKNKGSKSEERVNKQTGFKYHYSEGSMAFPDLLTNLSRTILTGEGGAGASRFKHIVEIGGRYRRLGPDELDRLQGFPKGWTRDMSNGHRAFCMGNALVGGIPHLIGCELAKRL